MKNKGSEKGHIWRFRVAFIVLIMAFSVLFLSSNAKALEMWFQQNADNTVNLNWNSPDDSFAFSFIPNATGIPTNITIDFNPVVGGIPTGRAGLLADYGGVPISSTLGNSSNQNLVGGGGTSGYNVFILENVSTLTANTTYWVYFTRASAVSVYPTLPVNTGGGSYQMYRSNAPNNFPPATFYQNVMPVMKVSYSIPAPIPTDFMKIRAVDTYNTAYNLQNFSADINGTIYNTTNGTITTSINKSFSYILNITLFSNENGGYFNKTYVNFNATSDLNASIYQAEANISIYAKILNYSIPVGSNTNSTLLNSTPVQSVNDYTKKVYLRANTNFTIRSAGGSYGYYIYTVFNVPPLFNGTLNMTGLYNQTLIVQLRDSINNSIINNYTLIVSNTTYNYSEIFTTNNGNITIPTLRNGFSFNFTFIPLNTNYSILYTNFTTIDNTSNFQRFYIISGNSINISIYNETSTTFINEPVNIIFTSDYMILNYNTNTGKIFITNIPEGFYSVDFIAPSGNYSERLYYVSVFNRTSQSLNVYLPQTNVSAPISIYLKTIDNNILDGGFITIQKQFNTSWLTIAQKYTDITGLAVFNLVNGAMYRFIISAENYTIREFELQVYYINSPYNIKLEPVGYTPYTNAYQYVQYYYNPLSSIVNPASPVNFSITTFSNQSQLEWTYINVNGSILNLTSSPSGATAIINYNLTNYQGVLPVVYGFKVQGFQAILWTINYYINQNQGYNDTDIYTTLTAVKTEINNQGWTSLIAIFVAVVVAITITQLSGNPTISIIGAFFVLIFFLLIGWLPLTAVAFASIIGLLMLYLQRGGY